MTDWKSNLSRPKGYENHTFPFVVNKGWGWERWLELFYDENTGREYCMKQIYIKAGTRTSLQVHKKKIETNFLLQGKAEAFLENNQGEMEKRIMEGGDSERNVWTIEAGKTHRIVALTDILLIESSTPEVDDVIRIEDDYGRK